MKQLDSVELNAKKRKITLQKQLENFIDNDSQIKKEYRKFCEKEITLFYIENLIDKKLFIEFISDVFENVKSNQSENFLSHQTFL